MIYVTLSVQFQHIQTNMIKHTLLYKTTFLVVGLVLLTDTLDWILYYLYIYYYR